jgi:hypothetical protein
LFPARMAYQRANQLFFAHRMPTGETLGTGKLCKILAAAVAK